MNKTSKPYRVVDAEEIEMVIRFVRCQRCGEEITTLFYDKQGNSPSCPKCNFILSKSKKEEDFNWITKGIRGYICPECGEHVSNSKSNWTGLKTVDYKNAIICPNTGHEEIILNGLPLLRHGKSTEFEPFFSGVDYFSFRHKSCVDMEHKGYSEVYATIKDDEDRVVFNIQCRDCRAVDAIKTSTERFFRWEHIEYK